MLGFISRYLDSSWVIFVIEECPEIRRELCELCPMLEPECWVPLRVHRAQNLLIVGSAQRGEIGGMARIEWNSIGVCFMRIESGKSKRLTMEDRMGYCITLTALWVHGHKEAESYWWVWSESPLVIDMQSEHINAGGSEDHFNLDATFLISSSHFSKCTEWRTREHAGHQDCYEQSSCPSWKTC